MGFLDVDYTLNFFGGNNLQARRQNWEFVKKGAAAGRRPDLTGGGLVRSAGGWSASGTVRRAESRMKGDERILGEGDFVEIVLKAPRENLDMLLGDAETRVKRGRDIEEIEHRLLDGKRICGERPANRRRTRADAT